jgi:outer membrane protein assembly factor BamB
MWTSSAKITFGGLLGLVLLAPALTPGYGQAAGPRARPATATLPESNEAALLSGRVHEAIQRGDYRLAIRLIEQIMQLPGELVAVPGSRTRYPARHQAYRLLQQLPPAGVQLYRRLYDAGVTARFQRAAQSADVAALRELFRVYRLSSAWPEIGRELAALLLDQGVHGEAIEVLREVLPGTDGGDLAARQAQLLVALTKAGAWSSAERVLAELRADPALKTQPARRERVRRLEGWVAACRHGGRDSLVSAGPALVADQTAAPRWSQPLRGLPGLGNPDSEADLAVAVDTLRRLPLHEPVLEADVLVVRLGGTIWAWDALTLTPLWQARETEPADAAVPMRSAWFGGDTGRAASAGGSETAMTAQARLLLLHALGHAVSAGLGQVYTIEGLTLGDADDEPFGQLGQDASGGRNELVARDLPSGERTWRTGADPAHALYGVAFQDCPVVVGDKLVAPFVRGNELSLGVLDPSSGRLIREVPVVGPPTRFTAAGGRCRLGADETTLYVCTGNGVIAAFAREGLGWKWALVYPSTLAEHLSRAWWQADSPLRESGVDRPVVADELLVVAPVDSREILAIDRFNGRERWHVERGEYAFVVGAVDAGLVVGGYAIACLDPADGRAVRWRSVPLEITGRPAIHGQQIYVPTRGGIVVIDGGTGKVVADQSLVAGTLVRGAGVAPAAGSAGLRPAGRAATGQVVAANLAVCGEALFAVSPNRVVKYPDVHATRARCQALLVRNAADERAALTLAWLDLFEGDLEAALARLETMQLSDTALAASRNELLGHVCVALAREARHGAGKLAWLHRAAALAESPESAARLAALIGRALEQSRRWDEALEHYRRVLLREPAGYVRVAGDEDREVVSWLHAVERIGVVLNHVPAEQAETFLDQLVGDVADTVAPKGIHGSAEAEAGDAPSATLLQRVRLAVRDPIRRARIERALMLRELPPELAIRCVASNDDPMLPVPIRRRLHLERWDTHVSLGLLDEARADRAHWQEHYASSPRTGEPASPALGSVGVPPASEAERVTRIELAMRKLEQGAGISFTDSFTRQWLLPDAELILDARRPATASRPWIPVRHLVSRQIALHSAMAGAPLRQTPDGLSPGHGERAETTGSAYGPGRQLHAQAVYGRSAAWGGAPRDSWPAVLDDHLAAVPVGGGLVCVGLGPERGGGRRLWERAVPEWKEIPQRFAEIAVATPDGLCFATRDSRVVMVAWPDGELRWQRDLAGMRVARLHVTAPVDAGRYAAATIVVESDEQQVVAFDAATGGRLRRLPTELGTPRAIEVVANTLVVWGDEWVAGIDPDTFEPRWRSPCDSVGGRLPVPERGWIAWQSVTTGEWFLLNVRDGKRVYDKGLSDLGEITAILTDADTLLLASWVGGDEETGVPDVVHLAALDLGDGRLRWARSIESTVRLNGTQLAAHPDFIPLLLLKTDRRPSDVIDLSSLAIQLLDKRSGRPLEPVPIGRHFRTTDAWCNVYMLATPTRMIVQAGGNVVAFGNSPLGRGP